MKTFKFESQDKGSTVTATMTENPKKTSHVDVRFYRDGVPFNRCIVRSSYILNEFTPAK